MTYMYAYMCMLSVEYHGKDARMNCGERGTLHRRFIYKDHTSTHAQGTDPRVALGA